MKSTLFLGLILAMPASAFAQSPNLPAPPVTRAQISLGDQMSLGELTPTPSMWFYEQERRRYDDPKLAVRANAEFRETQRMHRIAARRWFGFSNSRPIANPTPTTGPYSPGWISNTREPYLWSGASPSTTIVLPPSSEPTYGFR